MSIVDKVVAAVAPPESDADRLLARDNARAQALPGGWLLLILDDHDRIELAFDRVIAAADAVTQRAAEQDLSEILNGHSVAEEAVIYPELTQHSQKGHAALGYEEQAATKVQLALLGDLEPLTEAYRDKLEHIRGAVLHHMYQEETSWLVLLEREVPDQRQALLRDRYQEEMRRYRPLSD